MKSILSAVVGATLALSAIEADAQATPGERQVSLTIESTSLATALDKWAQQSGFQIFVQDWEATKNLRAPSLKGNFTAQDALEQLLSGTSLTYMWISDKAVSIRKKTSQTVPTALQRSSLDGQQGVQVQKFSGDDVGGASGTLSASDGDRTPTASSSRVDRVEEIVVTGTHIRGTQNKTASLMVIDRDQIERTGYSTTQELFRSLPQNFIGGAEGASDDGIYGPAKNAGANFTSANGVNLRGLGASSTLVLLNGHRIAPSALGTVVDVSMIPLSAIERVEILSDGSSALYGSDAVGGVVNIILKRDYQGADTSVRYGQAENGVRSEKTIAQGLGGNWDSGNVVANLQYQSQGKLAAEDRTFASNVTRPNDLLPDVESYGGAISGRQQFSDQVELSGNVLWSRRDTTRDGSSSTLGGYVQRSDARSDNLTLASGVVINLSPTWALDVGGEYSRQDAKASTDLQWLAFPLEQKATNDVTFKESGADIVVSGPVTSTPAGALSVAVGSSYRDERLTEDDVRLSGDPFDNRTKRDVTAFFGEMYAPIVGESNSLPLIHAFDVSIAFRYDDYSDFGSAESPRYGFRWSPASGIDVRAAYSESFRAPNAFEVINTTFAPNILTFPFTDPSGNGEVPAFMQTGSKRDLGPEKARTITIGLELVPAWLDGLNINLNYYHIVYSSRIISPFPDTNALIQPDVYGQLVTPLASDEAAQAFLDDAIAAGAQYFDIVGTGSAGVRHVIDFRQQNAAQVKQSGYDLAALQSFNLGSGVLSFRVGASYIERIDTELTVGATATDLVNTFGNPVKFRGRLDVGWATRAWSVDAGVNYTDSYSNTAALGTPDIASWTTIDFAARLNLEEYFAGGLLDNSSLGLTVQNLLDESPPFVDAPSVISVNYDPSNASPLGRFVALQFKKAW